MDPNVVRGLRPHIGARLPLPDGTFLGVWDVSPDGELLEVQPPGGRRMPYDAYRRGRAS